jgi:hypothetical protein
MKENTFYFSHDFNARSDQKIKRMLMRYGMQGYGIYWAIIEDLYQNANAMRTDYESIAFELRVDCDLVKSILNDFNLFVFDGENFGSLSVEKRMQERLNKSAKARESAFKRWDDATAMRTHTDRNAIKERKGKEKKRKETKKNNPANAGGTGESSKDFELNDLSNDKNGGGGEVPNQKENAPEPKETAKNQKQPTTDPAHKTCMDIYSEFYKQFGRPLRITPADAKGLKEIIFYIRQMPNVKDGKSKVEDAWKFILDNWGKLDKWHQTQTELRQINSRITNIIQQLKNNYGQAKSTHTHETELHDYIAKLRNDMGNR